MHRCGSGRALGQCRSTACAKPPATDQRDDAGCASGGAKADDDCDGDVHVGLSICSLDVAAVLAGFEFLREGYGWCVTGSRRRRRIGRNRGRNAPGARSMGNSARKQHRDGPSVGLLHGCPQLNRYRSCNRRLVSESFSVGPSICRCTRRGTYSSSAPRVHCASRSWLAPIV